MEPSGPSVRLVRSNFREDPLSRLARTIRWIFTVTYGPQAAANEASARVRRLHEPVQDRQRATGQIGAGTPKLRRRPATGQ